MFGKVRSSVVEDTIPCRYSQIDDNILVVDHWIWTPMEFSDYINISKCLKTNKIEFVETRNM